MCPVSLSFFYFSLVTISRLSNYIFQLLFSEMKVSIRFYCFYHYSNSQVKKKNLFVLCSHSTWHSITYRQTLRCSVIVSRELKGN